VSFIETGRSRPTSAMILRLCDELSVRLREQNRLLLASGYAPAHPEHGLAEPPMAQVSAAIDAVLTGRLYPAVVIDSGWDLVAANDAFYALLDGVAARLVEPGQRDPVDPRPRGAGAADRQPPRVARTSGAAAARGVRRQR